MSESNSADAEDTAAPTGGAAAEAEPVGGSSPAKSPAQPQASAPPPINTAAAEAEAEEGRVVSPMPSDPPPSPPGSNFASAENGGRSPDGGAGAYERVEVTDPQQHGEGRQRYTTYHVIVHPTRSDTKPTEVNRRYSDFQWLYRHLLRERAGAIVPIIPHVQAINKENRFSDEVVGFRRKSLDAWLNKVVVHPELHSSPSLAAFLKSDDTMFNEAKRSGDFSDHGDEQTEMEWGGSSSPKSGNSEGGTPQKKGAWGEIKAFAYKIKSGLRSEEGLERSEDEPAFDEINDYVTELETQIGWLGRHSTALVETYKGQSRVLESLGSKFSSLGKASYPNTHPSNAAKLSTLLNKIGDGVSALGMNESGRYDDLTERFDRPVQDLIRDVESVKIALAQRHEVQVKYTDKASKIQGKQNNLDEVKITNRNRDPRQQEVRLKWAEAALAEVKEAAEIKRAEFETVSARVIREVERFRTQFRDSVRAVVREWATIQAEYSGNANKGWSDILPFLDSPELVEGDKPGGFTAARQ